MDDAYSTASVLRLLADQLMHGTVRSVNVQWKCKHPEGNGFMMYPVPQPLKIPATLTGFKAYIKKEDDNASEQA